MKRVLWIGALCLCLGLLGSSTIAAGKIVLAKYPDLKLGFTTVNFMKQMPLNPANAKKWVDIAADLGFTWIELRDPMATLTLAECKEIAAYAKQQGIEMGYGTNLGLLDVNFWEVFSRGLANAAVFDGPRTIRTAAPGLEFATNEQKTHWSFAELQRAVETANQAANMAKMLGLQYIAETARRPSKATASLPSGRWSCLPTSTAISGSSLIPATSSVPPGCGPSRRTPGHSWRSMWGAWGTCT